MNFVSQELFYLHNDLFDQIFVAWEKVAKAGYKPDVLMVHPDLLEHMMELSHAAS